MTQTRATVRLNDRDQRMYNLNRVILEKKEDICERQMDRMIFLSPPTLFL